MAKVAGLFISPDKGLPMISRRWVEALENEGLKGDRYAIGKGAWSKIEKIRHVSLIEYEAICKVNAENGYDFRGSDTRRNIVTDGISLNNLVGKRFFIGYVEFEGIELCDPCERPSHLSGKSGFKTAFMNRGGLRAKIISGGRICIGSPIII